MKAIVLVGGEGTRLRPLTWHTPKSMVPVLNRPLIERLLLHLRAHGVTEVTLAMTRQHETLEDALVDVGPAGIALSTAYEETPLGSGGAIASIAGGWSETFLVCNGDIITDLDVTAMIKAHRQRGAELSISLHEVDDPSPFGVVELDETGRIRRFVEKPPREEAPSRLINAGTWIFEPSLLARMDGSRFNRVEETLFAELAREGRDIVGFHRPARWADIGNASALLRVNLELARDAAEFAEGSALSGQAIADDARIEGGASVEAPSVVGARSRIAAGASIVDSLLWEDVEVGSRASVSGSILATGVRVGADAVVRDAVIAHDAEIEPGARIEGMTIEPGTRVTHQPLRRDRKATP